MARVPMWRRYLRFWGSDLCADVDAELEGHLDMLVEHYAAEGMPAADAWARARRRFGDMRRVRTECLRVDETWETEKRWRGRVKALVQDLRFGARMLAKSRGFTAVAVLSLALGIGLNTAVFSVVDAMVFRPLPYGDPDRLVVLTLTDRQTADTWSYPQVPQYLSWKRHADVFEEIASPVETRRFDVASEGRPTERLQGARVSPNLFTTLGVEPLLGRDFLPDDEALGSEEVVILSHGLWRRRFGADPSVIGETLWLDRNPATIVGVLPSGSSPAMGVTPQFWVPARLTPADDQTFVVVTARLAPGVTLEQAQAAMDTVVAQHADAVPAAREGWGVRLVPLHEHFTRNLRHTLFTLWGAVGFVLLIACANVAGVLLARASARTQEVATRLALGASRWRVARLFLVEGVLLALVGGALGALLAYGGLHLIRLLNPDANPFISIFPRLNDASLNGRVLGYTLLVSLLTALLFSVAPALTGSTPDRTGSRKDAGRGAMAGAERLRLRSALVVAQIALALVLLSGAGLLVNTMRYLAQVDPGFDAERLLTFRLELAEARYLQDAAIAGEPQTLLSPRLDAFHARVLRRLETLSGVESAAAIDILPLSHTGAKRILAIDGYPAPAPGEEIRREDVDEWVRPTYRAVGGDYFDVMGIRLLQGRAFTAQDAAEAPWVVVINRAMAETYWPDKNPIGKQLTVVRGVWGGPAPGRAAVHAAAGSRWAGPGETQRPTVPESAHRVQPPRGGCAPGGRARQFHSAGALTGWDAHGRRRRRRNLGGQSLRRHQHPARGPVRTVAGLVRGRQPDRVLFLPR